MKIEEKHDVTDNLDDLEDCPFCGAKATHASVLDGAVWWVVCTGDCMCEIGTERTREAATKAWNTRV